MVKLTDNIPLELPGDGIDYEVLAEAVRSVDRNHIPGMLAEIGVRLGGGIHTMIDATVVKRPVIGIDPYGDIEYPTDGPGGQYTGSMRRNFTNAMRNECMANMFLFCAREDIDFHFYNMTDYEFFNRFADGVPFYDQEARLETSYAVVHIDGPHNTLNVSVETHFFKDRMLPGAVLVYDNVDYYDHMEIEYLLLEKDGTWEKLLTSTNKWSYIKMR